MPHISRFSLAFARIAAGISLMASLTWLLWNGASKEAIELEPTVSSIVFFIGWVAIEFRSIEEPPSTPNDIRLARQILQYHAEQFRILLRDHDYHSTLDPRLQDEVGFFLNDVKMRHLGFQDRRVRSAFSDFILRVEAFSTYLAHHSSQYKFAGGLRVSVRPPDEMCDYDIPERYKEEIKKLNNLAKLAWDELDILATKVKETVPEALDEPLKVEWRAPDPHSNEVLYI